MKRGAAEKMRVPPRRAWSKKFARTDHHDIPGKFFLGYHGDLRVQIFIDQARRGGTRIFSAAPRFIPR